MSAQRILTIGLATQAVLIGLAWGAAKVFDVPLRWGTPWPDAAIGVLAAAALAAGNHWLLTRAPSNWLVTGIRFVYRDTLVPLFNRLSSANALMLGVAAGIAEEWLFRGIIQPLVGLVAASLVFGLAHVGGRHMLPLGLWAAGMGAIMGSLAIVTGGVIAPMVAHGLYDILALEYIRRDPCARLRVGTERETDFE